MNAFICVNLILLLIFLLAIVMTIEEKRRLNKISKNVREIGDTYEKTIEGCNERMKNADEHFTKMQESTLSEVSDAINNLKAGRYEEVCNILTALADVLTTDIVFAKENKKN